MLTVYRSNRSEWLAELLAEQLRVNPPGPLETVEVMVNTWSTSRWLSEKIATVNGICAEVDFPFPNTYLRKLIQLYLGLELSTEDPWQKNKLAWSIIDVLPELLKNQEASYLLNWINTDFSDSGILNKKQWKLANKLATTFNDYILYRPRLISEWWNIGDLTDKSKYNINNPEIRWQLILFNLLRNKIKSEPFNIQVNKAIKALKRKDSSRNKLPVQLHVFGISSMAPIQIELIQAFSSILDVKMFITTPCQDLWKRCRDRRETLGDDWEDPVDGFWLLKAPRIEATLGRMGAEFQQLLEGSGEYQLGEWNEQDLFSMPVKIALNNSRTPSLIEQLQESLLDSNTTNQLNRNLDDDSLVFLRAPGARRQVQLIRDQIIQWFAADNNLQPKDIIIMTPEIEKIAPLIASIFNDVSATGVNIPWTITDRTQHQKPGPVQFILEIIEIASTGLTSINLEHLLRYKFLKDRYGLDYEDIEKMIESLNRTGFRGGIDENDRNGDETHSLKWCLERWLLGIVISKGSAIASQGIAPFSENRSVNEISNWLILLTKINKYLQKIRVAKDCKSWVELLKRIQIDFSHQETSLSWELELFNLHIDDWLKIAGDSSLKLEPSVVWEILKEYCSLESGRFGHRSGKITISALEPMRAIPHKIIILMGLENSNYPHHEDHPSFNLLTKERLLGDPKSSDKDRYVLLESLISCREKLLIAWNYRDEKTGEELEAPGPIHQLIEYIRGELNENTIPGLIRTAPPNPLSKENFVSNDFQPPISCDIRNLKARTLLDKESSPKALALGLPIKWSENHTNKSKGIPNQTIKSWLTAPQLTWLNQFNLKPRNEMYTIDSLEPIHLEELQRFNLLKKQFLYAKEILIKQKDISAFNEKIDWQIKLMGQGILPPRAAAETECEILQARWESLSVNIKTMGQLEEKQLSIGEETIKVLYAGINSIVIDIGKLKAKTIMTAWLQHLQVCAYSDNTSKTYILSRANTPKKRDQYHLSAHFAKIDKQEARNYLKDIYSIVDQGLEQCWPIPPESGWALSKAKYENRSNAKGIFKRVWTGDFKRVGEREKEEMRISFGEDCNSEIFFGNKIFEDCLKTLYGPLLNSLII
ncbi:MULTISPECIES: exodeoxyribonuclease V subunit gamma [unclassified Prochlorococcus]|uniref:exodeoxyribonuclease V subunit gamma n=1 Tax=unclassified Prochlorococcus TaxID=2627481 RepID=UPI00053376DB|nr:MULTISPECIES: exodeoxyribonuclease V subunit gamma [unclassified Prochlorococcus]KGG15415.1 Exodeoxyribonuclease V gamma chain [Prochlorococcus sp. MIT 0602]KGG17693.1 Exodeoxyribonuclease V gamma chain [Prochlorococcus sp. MIT 0603]